MSQLKWLECILQCLVALVICFSLLDQDKSEVWGGASTKETGPLSSCPAFPAVLNLVDCLVLLVYFKMRAVCCVTFLPKPVDS